MLNCASRIKTKTLNDQNPFDYRTFAYLTDTDFNASTYNRELDSNLDESAIQQMKIRMNKLGFAMDSKNPDLVVFISNANSIGSNLQKDGTNSAASQSASSGMMPYSGSSSSTTTKRYTTTTSSTPTTRPFKNGNMVIEIFNAKTKALVWVGTAKNFKTDIAGQNLSVMMVDEIFNEFP
jgi:hypothetical protein